MQDKVIENNQVKIIGTIVSGFTYSHEIFGEGFFMMDVECRRFSDTTDTIPVMVSERLVDVNSDYSGEMICVTGQFRSYNRHEDRKNRLVLSVFARDIVFQSDGQEEYNYLWDEKVTNDIFIDGYLCKPTVYRKTPLGREISDMLIAVNRPYGKSDYIPVIAWGRNARFADGFRVGERIQIWGRIQSREYMKKVDEDTMERRVAYEVSCAKLGRVDDEQ